MDQIPTGEDAGARDRADVIVELSHHHARIIDLIGSVRRSTGLERLTSFEELREFLIMHETAEQLVVRPVVASILGEDEPAAWHREDEQTEELLGEAELTQDGGHDVDFLMRFAALERQIGAHTAREEGDEWAALASGCDEEQRARMGRQLQAATASVRGRRPLGVAPEPADAGPRPEPLPRIVERTYRAISEAA